MRADRLNNRIKCNNTGADPIGERRCVDLYTFPRIGGTLPVQRLMHQELRDQHHGKQARASEATRDRMRWRRRLGDRFAVPAGELFPHMLDDLPAPRLTFERLGHDLAKPAQPQTAAFAASARRGLDDPFDRQIVRQLARPTCRAGTSFFGSLGRGSLGLRLRNGLRLLEILNGELELLDELLAALGGLPKLCTPRLSQHQLQTLDLQGADLRLAFGSNPQRLLFGQELALCEDQRVGARKIGRERIGRVGHDPIQPYSLAKIAFGSRS